MQGGIDSCDQEQPVRAPVTRVYTSIAGMKDIPMKLRTWGDSLKVDELYDNTRVLIIEPGDCTRYELLVIGLANEVCAHMGLSLGSYVVCNHNLTGLFSSMPFFKGQYLSWRHVNRHLHVSAPGSCWMITRILGKIYDTQYQTYEEFEQSVINDLNKKS